MFAIDIETAPLEQSPFPHCVVNGILPTPLFRKLQQSYPICPPASGPTGHTIHRGDAEFDAVMAGSVEWRALFEHCNSGPFLGELAGLFAGEIDDKCLVERYALTFADHIETREEKEASRIANPALPPEAMFCRFDFMQGMGSYVRRPHLDHRRRLATMLIYFDAPGPDSFTGGDLLLHDSAGGIVRRIAPAENQAVLFPCSERSWHSVDAVTHCQRPRRFAQIALSGCHDMWPDALLPAASIVDWGKRLLARVR